MNCVILNGNEFSSELEVHHILKEKLELPDYYGENFDALWDCLTGWIELPIKIIWIDYEHSKKNLGEFASNLLELFVQAKNEIDGFDVETK